MGGRPDDDHTVLTQSPQKFPIRECTVDEDHQRPIPLDELRQNSDTWAAAISDVDHILKDPARVRALIPHFLPASFQTGDCSATQRTQEIFDALARDEQPNSTKKDAGHEQPGSTMKEAGDEQPDSKFKEAGDREDHMLSVATFLWKTHRAMITQDAEESSSRQAEGRNVAMAWMETVMDSSDSLKHGDIGERLTDALHTTLFHAVTADARRKVPANLRALSAIPEKIWDDGKLMAEFRKARYTLLLKYAIPLSLSVAAGSQGSPIKETGQALFDAVQEHVSALKLGTQLSSFFPEITELSWTCVFSCRPSLLSHFTFILSMHMHYDIFATC